MRYVTPLVGVWIEIRNRIFLTFWPEVTPLVGVWIEIMKLSGESTKTGSLPLWECGLKYKASQNVPERYSHSPCGSVD